VLEILESIDISLFRFLNGSLSNPIFDFLMPFITDLNKQRLVLVFVALILLWMLLRGKQHVKIAAVLLIVTIVFSDQLSSSVFKYWLERPRPCHSLHNVHLLVSCGSGYSFPSSHAVNNFAGALILAFFFPRSKWWFFGFAAIVAFSRVSVGAHYPSDIIGGAVIGLLCAGFVLVVFIALEKLWYGYQVRKVQEEEI
jgi:undecaprenyl-diphosphatase